jgi:predicted site-specific integrase-resolvase
MHGTDAPPVRMIGYCRVSTDEQAMSGLGLADQEKRIREMAKPHGWRITQIVRDEGLSAGTLERAGLYRALGQLAAGRADGLVVAKLDRLTRSTVDFGLLLEWFKDAGKTLVLLDLGVDTSTAGGELVANVIASSRSGSAASSASARAPRSRSSGCRASPPAGPPSSTTRRSRPDPRDEATDEELTLRQIADRLNAEGVPTMRGAAKWQPSAIQSALGYKRPRKPRRIAELPSRADAHPARAPAAALRGHARQATSPARSAAASTRCSPAGTRSSAAA